MEAHNLIKGNTKQGNQNKRKSVGNFITLTLCLEPIPLLFEPADENISWKARQSDPEQQLWYLPKLYKSERAQTEPDEQLQ